MRALIEGCVRMKYNNEKVMESFYQYIGQHHIDNTSEFFDEVTELSNDVELPETLDQWFKEYLRQSIKIEKNKRIKRRVQTLSKRAAIFLVVFSLSVLMTTLSVDAFRIKLFNMITEVKEKYTSISITEKNQEIEDTFWSSYFKPQFVPKDYKLTDGQSFGALKIMFYTNNAGKELQFSQTSSNPDFQVDTENAKVSDVIINGEKGILVEKDNISTLIWTAEENTFFIMGELNRDTIIKMAESIKLVEK